VLGGGDESSAAGRKQVGRRKAGARVILTPQAIVLVAKGAGFDAPLLPTLCAVALRESAGNPAVHNGNAATGDDSWGLWQINLKVPQIAALLAKNGITNGPQLLDPATNARAYKLLFDSEPNKMKALGELAYIYDGLAQHQVYQTRYEQHLPVAQWAALQVALGVVT
jgi:hypothetical protein